jgi:hypothetical protein
VAVGALLVVTVSVALLLTAVPNALLTTALNAAPLSVEATEGIVKLDAVAPLMFTPFLRH